MPVASEAETYRLVRTLMEEGLTVGEARERLCNEIDEACDQIAYGDE